MIWCGEVTNDTLEPLRAFVKVAGPRGRPLAMKRPTRAGPSGRFSLRSTRWDKPITDTEHRAALARALLDRYGVVVRESAHAETIASGFSAVYDVFKTLEESGRIRRGYFVDGAGAAQFATAEAADRLRLERARLSEASTEPARWLASTDPANAYGVRSFRFPRVLERRVRSGRRALTSSSRQACSSRGCPAAAARCSPSCSP